jgi:hypothetical protein
VFETTNAWLNDRPLRRELLPFVTSVATTGVIAWAAARHLFRRPWGDTARAIAIFATVLAVNALMSFAYTKDEIMSVAGVFYAIAAFAAVRELAATSVRLRFAAATATAVLMCVLATAWSIRAAGVHFVLRSQAIKHQIDWVELPGRWHRDQRWPTDPAEERLILQLRADAIHMKLPNTRIGRPDWPDRLWIE